MPFAHAQPPPSLCAALEEEDMANTCTHCSRVNPAGAAYCYFDGSSLNRQGGPQNIGAQQFPSPFIFPSGRSCRSFDQLALACQQEWPAAVQMLQGGFL